MTQVFIWFIEVGYIFFKISYPITDHDQTRKFYIKNMYHFILILRDELIFSVMFVTKTFLFKN